MSEAQAIGDQLKAARERMGLGVAQAAERLHVDGFMIEAIEAGRFSVLGAPVFVRGHLRHYAELLGESPQLIQDRYAAMQEASVPPDLTAVRKLPPQQTRAPRRRWPLIVIAVALVLLVAIWWAMGVGAA
jgi:cytoskeleton protein RodZ